MASSKILILGNSHSDAIRRAVTDKDNIEVFWLKSSKSRYGDLDIKEGEAKIQALAKSDGLVLMNHGALHNVIGLLNHPARFCLIESYDDSQLAELIPKNVMKDSLAAMVETETHVARLSALASCSTFHIMTPPPKEHLIMPKSDDKKYQGQVITEAGYAPAVQRLAMWQLESDVIESYMAKIGVVHVPPPPGTTTPEGYLHPDYQAKDATHANAAYGLKVVEQIKTLTSVSA